MQIAKKNSKYFLAMIVIRNSSKVKLFEANLSLAPLASIKISYASLKIEFFIIKKNYELSMDFMDNFSLQKKITLISSSL